MEIHPILEEWLNHWVWPTPFRGPGVDFRMHLTRERLVPIWNRIVIRALEGAKATESKYNQGEYPNAFGGYAGEGPRMSMNQMYPPKALGYSPWLYLDSVAFAPSRAL